MSTSFPSGSPAGGNSNGSSKKGVSLRGMLTEAVFVGSEDIVVQSCCNRAAKVKPGDVFVPDSTCTVDQHELVDEAVKRGAIAVVSERLLTVSVPQCLVEDTALVYGQICQALVGNPSTRMLTIGVIGTHGKTLTALHVSAMLKRLGGAVAYYTSLGSSDSTFCDRTATRPPAARKLAHWLHKADQAGAPAAVIELTPAMLKAQVDAGVEFDVLIVTSLRSGQVSGAASSRQMRFLIQRLVSRSQDRCNIIYNADDALASEWISQKYPDAVSYGIDASEHVRAKRLSRFGGEQQLLVIAGNKLMPLCLKTPGDHTGRAALAAIATAWLFEFNIPEAIAGVEALDVIPGRLQKLQQAVEVPLYIDVGNTPDRIAVALHSLRTHQLGTPTTVVDLDARLDSKWRTRLGEILEKSGGKVVLCASDLSPEAVQGLAMDVLGGCKSPGKVQVIPDRKAAIEWAVANTHEGCILLSGCGAKVWMGREGEPLSDEGVARDAVTSKNSKAAVAKLGIFPPSEPPASYSH